jgi:cadmium resistance transport/sequestration family protein
LEIVFKSIIAFASTNVDDIFILILFFGNKKYKPLEIYLGQYLGVGILVCISLVGVFIGNFFDARFVGLLGLFPIYLGLKQIIGLLKNGSDQAPVELEKKSSGFGIFSVAAVTFANGGDNVGVYVPLFATLSPLELTTLVAIFFPMILLWLLTAQYLTKHPLLANVIAKYGHIVTPVVLILLGVFILKESGSFSLLTL